MTPAVVGHQARSIGPLRRVGWHTRGCARRPMCEVYSSVKIRVPHHARQKKRDFPKKADITLAYGADSATTHFRYGVCTSERQEAESAKFEAEQLTKSAD